MAIGTAYQIYDDCLDLFGSEAAAGKSLGTDLVKGKLTLPILLALEHASADERARIQSLIGTWDGKHFPQLLEVLDAHGALPQSRDVVHQHLQTARQKLAALPESEGRAGLDELADYLGRQTDALGAHA
jgi:octaprenyl-diphosphate synthase